MKFSKTSHAGLPSQSLTTPIGGTALKPLAFLTCVVLLAACSKTSAPQKPQIDGFSSNPTTIAAGGSSTLSWMVTGADRLSLDPGAVDVTGKNGLGVSPLATTVYTLTATNEAGSHEAQTTLTVTTPGSPEVSLTGLEATTYVSGSLTFTVAVVGGAADGLELRRDGQLFQILSGNTFTWDTAATPEGSYSFVARARLGAEVFDSPPKVVIVDHTAPTVTLTATPSASPLVLPGSVVLSATAGDANGVPKVEFFDGSNKVAEVTAAPYELKLALTKEDHALHRYSAKVSDRAGNAAQTPGQSVTAYVRQTATLPSEAALDGCVENGYNPASTHRYFTDASCTFTTSYAILHFFSFDRSVYPVGTQVEKATLHFNLSGVTADAAAKLASVSYDRAAGAPPTLQVYPYVSNEPEEDIALTTAMGGFGRADEQRLEVSALVQADVAAERSRSQFRLRSLTNGPGGLGGTLYFSEVGDERVPTLEVQLLVP